MQNSFKSLKVCLLIFPCLMLLTACSSSTLTIEFLLYPNTLTIPRGGEGSVFFDVYATNLRSLSVNIPITNISSTYGSNAILVTFPQNNQLLNCQTYPESSSGTSCSYHGSTTRDIDVKQFEIKFQIPEGHDLGIWELSSSARADSLENSSFIHNKFASLGSPLTLTVTD